MSDRRILLLLAAACVGGDPAPTEQASRPKLVAKPPPEPVDTGPEPSNNRAPRIGRITFEPSKPTTNDDVTVSVEVTDADDDPIDLDYQWSKNGRRVLHLTRETVPSKEFAKGDVLTVEITAADREEEVVRDSDPLKIINAVPTFISDPRNLRKIHGFKVEADDPDGDRLKYSLKGAPRGMTIDARSGVLSYEGSPDEPGGDYTVSVIAADPSKAQARWQFALSVSPGSTAKGDAQKTGARETGARKAKTRDAGR